MNRQGRWFFGIFTALTAIALLFGRCTLEPISGGGTEGGNTVSGVFIDDKGDASAKASILLVPSDYNPCVSHQNDSTIASVTASDGGYSIAHVPRGSYSIEAKDSAGAKRSLITGITVSATDIRIPVDTLRIPGSIKVFLPPAVSAAAGYVYVPGTTISIKFTGVDSGYVVLDSAPAKPLPAICCATLSDPTPVVLRRNVRVVSGDTAIVAQTGWNYARRFRLNTTTTGAGVSQSIVGFPVIVRLTKENFDFTQAKADGGDVRFFRSDTIRLPYEIERWDGAGQRAEIWVRVDTIYGNNDTQTVTMYWGNGAAGDNSNGAAVFDTATGFQGVWHLAEPANAILHDATTNKYNGTPSDTAPTPVTGAIGIAREFNGVSNEIRMKETASGKLNFPENGHYTVSAWVYSDTLDNQWHLIVGKSNGQYYLKQQNASRNGNWEFVEYHDKSAWQISETPVILKTWKYLTGIRDGDKQCLYLDGQLVDSTAKPNYDTASRNTSDDVTIGKYQTSVKYENEGYCFFKGKIDEVRISNAPHSPDWIKLCFMNQRADDRLVVFLKND